MVDGRATASPTDQRRMAAHLLQADAARRTFNIANTWTGAISKSLASAVTSIAVR